MANQACSGRIQVQASIYPIYLSIFLPGDKIRLLGFTHYTTRMLRNYLILSPGDAADGSLAPLVEGCACHFRSGHDGAAGMASAVGQSARPGLMLGLDASTQPHFKEMRMLNAQSRLLPTTPGFELSNTQTDYFKRRRDGSVGFPGSECYKKCHEKPGKCDHFCAEEGFWTGSCCKFGASGDEECNGRGCIGFHCCVADVVTSEEEEDTSSKR
eukprot:scaffold108586_cov33-Phaeocystis_antarctica.AAC.1